MRVSVVIPCHNAGRWIAATLRSVAAQTFPAHEILVIDDDSHDDSTAIIEATGVPVKLLHTKAGNAAAARNAGIAVATGNWVALLDADDVWYPNHLARARELLTGSPDVAFMAAHDWIDLEGGIIPIPDSFIPDIRQPERGLSGCRFLELTMAGFHFGHSTVLYRTDRLRAVGAFDPAQRRRHDLDLWLRMVAGHTWTYDTERSAGYREGTPGSISKALVECECYHLRALLKNRESYRECAAMQALLKETARKLMGLAFVDGTRAEFAEARGLAWPFLTPGFRAWYRAAPLAGPFARWAMRVRRRVVMGPG